MSEQSYLDALQAVEAARAGLEADMVAAKDAYKADPSPENKAARDEAIAVLQAARAHERGNRATTVGGDAFVTPEEG